MKIFVSVNSTGWIQAGDQTTPPPGHVMFDGQIPQNPIWDNTLGNIREKTAEELLEDQRSIALEALDAVRQAKGETATGLIDLYAQVRMLRQAASIERKERKGNPLSPRDSAIKAQLEAMDFVLDQLDAAYDAIIAEIQAATDEAELSAIDVTDPARWP